MHDEPHRISFVTIITIIAVCLSLATLILALVYKPQLTEYMTEEIVNGLITVTGITGGLGILFLAFRVFSPLS